MISQSGTGYGQWQVSLISGASAGDLRIQTRKTPQTGPIPTNQLTLSHNSSWRRAGCIVDCIIQEGKVHSARVEADSKSSKRVVDCMLWPAGECPTLAASPLPPAAPSADHPKCFLQIHIHAVPKINSLIMDGLVGTAFLTLSMLPIARLVLKRCTPPSSLAPPHPSPCLLS